MQMGLQSWYADWLAFAVLESPGCLTLAGDLVVCAGLQFVVESAFGGYNGLKQFVNAAHARGIGVFLDVVWNHLGALTCPFVCLPLPLMVSNSELTVRCCCC